MPLTLSTFRLPLVARTTVAALLAMLVFVITAAMWKPLHQWLHGDADDGDHDCAIALYVSGSCEQPCVEVIVCPAPVHFAPERIDIPNTWAPNISLSARMWERGPPRNS